MANTYTTYCRQVPLFHGKVIHGITGGANTVSIKRVGMLNTQITSITGVIGQMDLLMLGTTVTWTDPVTVTPIAHDTTDGAPDVVAGSAGSPSTTGTVWSVKRFLWSSTTPSTTTNGYTNEWECMVPMNIVWDTGYQDTNISTIVIHDNEMFCIMSQTGAVGNIDSWVEFTEV